MDRTNGTRESLTQLRAAAHRLEDQSKFAEAATTYGQAATLDPDSADLQFGWGHCLLAAGDTAAAREHFQQACDLDALPFRTDSRLNAILRHTAQEMAGPNLHFFDAAACLATNSPGDIPGQEYFYEHVHFNFDGNYRLARAWAEQIAPLLPPAQTHGALAAWASQEQCERRLGLTDWNRLIVLGDVLGRVSQPPLSTQANNAHRQATLAAWKNRLQEQIAQPGAAAQARQLYREALERVPDDYCLHENYGTFLVATGDLPGATAQWQRVRELIPQDYLANFRAGELLAQGPEPAAAEAPLREAIRLRPFMSDAWTELGKLYLRQQKFALALEQLNHAIELQPLDFVAWFNSGISLSKLNRRPEAIERYRHTIRINAGYWQAHFELGGQLGLQGELEQAKQQLEQAIAIEPKFAPAHLDLGVALMKLGQPDGAAKEFEETIRLDPGNRFAASYLGQLRRK